MLALLLACNGSKVDSGASGQYGPGDLLAVPYELTLGAPAGERTHGEVVLYNSGEGALTLLSVTTAGEGFALEAPLDGPVTLLADQAWAVEVSFEAPEAAGDHAGTLSIESDVEGVLTLPLVGVTQVGALTSEGASFEVAVGCEASAMVTLVNVGEADVVLSALAITGAGFSLVPPELPATVSPGAELTVEVGFAPASEGALTGTLVVDGGAVAALDGVGLVEGGELSWVLDEARPVDWVIAVEGGEAMVDHHEAIGQALVSVGEQLTAESVDWRALLVLRPDGCGVVVDPADGDWASTLTETVGGAESGRRLLSRLSTALREPCRPGWPGLTALPHLLVVSESDDTSGGEVADWLDEGWLLSGIFGLPPDGCEDAGVGYRYAAAVDIAGGEALSLCAPTGWVDALVAASLLPKKSDFLIPASLDVTTLEVAVSGVSLSEVWWRWAADERTLSIEPSRLSLGAAVDVRWVNLPDCEESG